MSIFLSDILTALQEELDGHELLPTIDVVEIRKYRRTNLPEFLTGAILISPATATPRPYPAGGQRWIRYKIDLVVLLKIETTESQATEDIVAIYEAIFRILYKNDLGGEIELIPGITELDSEASFSILGDEDRGDFVMEMVVPFCPSGERFITLPE